MTRSSKPRSHTNSKSGPGGGPLTHLPSYGVVICGDCRFAVQPSALSSHLQSHHILRSERRRILDQLSTLKLLPPEQVSTPPSDAGPVPHLPILDGYKCTSQACNYACTSSKRMSQHWSEIHGQPNSHLVEIRTAKLQTFFRGNKIRYFEVSGPAGSACWTQKQTQHARDTQTSVPSPESSASLATETNADTTSDAVDDSHPPQLDFRALEYMHHYTTTSGLCLHRGTDSPVFWTTKIPYEAQKHPFLMYGVLSTAAIHKAFDSGNEDERKRHFQAAATYQAGCIPGFRANVASPSHENSTAIIACSRLLGVQDSVQDLLELNHKDRECSVADILEVIVLLRGCGDLLLDLQAFLPWDSAFRLPPEVEQGLRQFEDSDYVDPALPGSHVPPEVRNVLDTLEARLIAYDLLPAAEIVRLQPIIHVLAAAVAHSYEVALGQEWPVWNALEGFVRSRIVRENLMPALELRQPAALVLFAMWALLLLKRMEESHWYMRGMTSSMVRMAVQVAECDGVEALLRDFSLQG